MKLDQKSKVKVGDAAVAAGAAAGAVAVIAAGAAAGAVARAAGEEAAATAARAAAETAARAATQAMAAVRAAASSGQDPPIGTRGPKSKKGIEKNVTSPLWKANVC